jgi:hypothetical protein
LNNFKEHEKEREVLLRKFLKDKEEENFVEKMK